VREIIWLDSASVYCNTFSMEVHFTVEQELRLGQIASVEGIAPTRLVQEAALLLIEGDERFRAGVRKGIEQADQGLFIDEDEMDARVSRMLNL
jgi:predicted transcriptional regulator